MSKQPKYPSLLGGLQEAADIAREKGCTFAEALEEWRASVAPPPASNVIYGVDFANKVLP